MGEVSRLDKVKTQPRSVSQINQYTKCPHAYYLERVERVWQRPAAWLPQGTAVHQAAEDYEVSERTLSTGAVRDAFSASYAATVNALGEVTPNTEYWFASGPYRGATDIERRYGLGVEQVARYVEYYAAHPDERIWVTPDGTPAIELRFELDLDGVTMIGYIDQVIRYPDGRVHVRDIKSGNKPGDDFQLAVYAVAVNAAYGVNITTGDYWMGRTGRPTKPYDLSGWTRDRIAERVHDVDRSIKAGRFDADPEPSKCNFCSVSSSCSFFR